MRFVSCPHDGQGSECRGWDPMSRRTVSLPAGHFRSINYSSLNVVRKNIHFTVNHHLTSFLLSLLTYVWISSTVSISRSLKARIWSPLWKRHESWIFRQSETLERMNAQQWEQCKLFRLGYILICNNCNYLSISIIPWFALCLNQNQTFSDNFD